MIQIKMSVKKFETIITACGLKMEKKKYDCVKGLNLLGKLPVLRELFINQVTGLLVNVNHKLNLILSVFSTCFFQIEMAL